MKETLFSYMQKEIRRLSDINRPRSSETLNATLNSLLKFRRGKDLRFHSLTPDILVKYEAWMRGQGLIRNTTSFYMRNLHTVYSRAVKEGLVKDANPFRDVYTGVDKTHKRAISLDSLRTISRMDLHHRPALEFARDMLMFSFYTRGMSFVDMAYLTKKDIVGGYISYRRKKTGQLLNIEYCSEIQRIVCKYKMRSSDKYLLPIIDEQRGNPRRDYLNKLTKVNRNLKKVGEMAGVGQPLSMYVARHTWATIARDEGIHLSVISEGLGHDNERTTQIYLDSISTPRVDEAHRLILSRL